MDWLTTKGALRVPEVTIAFWVIKGLSTAMGESTSDYLVHAMAPELAVVLGFVGFVVALVLQFRAGRYVAWTYWFAVVMVGIFGTMAADVVHVGLGVPYTASTILYAAVLIAVFVTWQRTEKTLSIHSIDTPRREAFYWATVGATFATGTALGDFTAYTLKLGYFPSAVLFLALVAVAAIGFRVLRWNAIFSFWFAYVMTRPPASYAGDNGSADRRVSMHNVLLVTAAFLASTVEMVEALTIVLAVGVTRGWRSAGWGVAVAIGSLTVIVAGLGPSLAKLPIDSLRLIVGTVLLVFGLQWLRKAVLRASGLKALHDEEAIFEAEVALLRANGEPVAHDWYAFTVAFKGVFLEGLEVAFIVVTFGGTQRNVGLAAVGAAAALVVVLIAGIFVHAPLTRVPENTLKFGVGVMLTSFGIFWSSEGAGIKWPGSDASLLGLIGFVIVVAFALVGVVRRVTESAAVAAS